MQMKDQVRDVWVPISDHFDTRSLACYNAPMRILLVSGEYPPMQGGVGDYTREMARAFSAQGHDVWVLVPAGLGATYSQRSTSPRHVLPLIRNWKWGSWGQVLSALREARPDVIDIQYQAAAYDMRSPAINLLPWRLRRSGIGTPIVVTYHDLKPPYLFPKAGPLRERSLRVLARHSDAIVLTNEEDYLEASAWPFACPPSHGGEPRAPHRRCRTTIHQVPIGSNIAVSPPAGYDRTTWRTRLGYGPGDFVWAYFGFLNESKGGETLISALAASDPDTHLLMIGGRVGSSDATNRAYAARVESMMAELGITDRVQWTGYVPVEEVSAALLSADVLVLPYRDGISFRRGSLHAALAHGCAIVSTLPRVPLAELHDGDNVLLVPPGDPEATCRAAARLRHDPALRLRIGQGADELARQFTWAQIARRTVNEVFDPLLPA